MPAKKSKKYNGNSKNTKQKSPQANGHSKHRANGSRIDYIVNAREVISLSFVRNQSEMYDMDSFFPPVYVHQLFTNEKIIGYKDLSIRLFFSQPALHCYIEIEYEEKLNNDDTTDIIAEFNKWIKAGFTQNKKEFLKKLEEPFSPIGHLQCQFVTPGLDDDQDDDDNDDEDDDDDDDDDDDESNEYATPEPTKNMSSNEDDDLNVNKRRSNRKTTPKSVTRSPRNVKRNTPRSNSGRRRGRPRKVKPQNNDKRDNDEESERESGHEGDDDSSIKSEELSPRNQRLRRRKRRMEEQENENLQPRKKRKVSHDMKSNNGENNHESELETEDSDEEEEKKDSVQQHVDPQDITKKENVITNSKFNDEEETVYEIRVASFGDETMRKFHERLQFFVLLFIESSSFLDEKDEIWEVMTISKRYKGRYETLGYLTLYKFYAYPDKKRLRISQVIMFPPFQRKGLGFEALQHVYNMAKYRDFIEVNVEDPGVAFTKLRNATDVYNADLMNCFSSTDFDVCNLTSYHDAYINGKLNGIKYSKSKIKMEKNNNNDSELSYSPNTKKNKKKITTFDHGAIIKDKPLFPFISQHKKLSQDIYHSAIMNAHKLIKISPEQARIAYEALKYEYIFVDRGGCDNNNNNNNNKLNKINKDDLEFKLYRLDVKRRLYVTLNIGEPIHNYDTAGLYARLTQEFNKTKSVYKDLLKKRDEMIKRYQDWDKTHEYPPWIEKKLNKFQQEYTINHKNKKKVRRNRRKKM